jgi:hypothetical protein
MGGLTAMLAERLTSDPHRAARETMRKFYFGELAPGESTERFIAAIGDAVSTRDRQLSRLDASLAVLPEDTTGRSA